MNDLKHQIEWFFRDILKSSVNARFHKENRFGYSCGKLLDDVLRTSVSDLAGRWANDFTGDSHEYRLNNAGLKIYWRTYPREQKIKIRLGGDQLINNPMFADKFNEILSAHSMVYKKIL